MKNRIDTSRQSTPWDNKDNVSVIENFIKDKYKENYRFKHPKLSDTDEAKIINSVKIDKCRLCNSSKIKKVGFTKNGIQRYFCNECKKYFTPTTGTITVKYDSTRTDLDPNGVVDITFSDGIVLLNSGKQFIAQIDMSALMPDMKVPVNLTITDDCGFHIYGRLAIPSGENSTIINNGTILVLEGGTLEIRDRADNYQGYGVLNIFGELAIYGTSGSNIGSQKINLEYGGSVYSEANVFDNIVKAPFDTSYFTYSLVEKTDKYYESVTPAPAVGGKTFPYAWTVEMTQVTDIPVTDPTDNPTIEEEATTENVENPETSDELLLFLGLTVVGFAGVALTYRRLHN